MYQGLELWNLFVIQAGDVETGVKRSARQIYGLILLQME
jgi:hypothetical protein